MMAGQELVCRFDPTHGTYGSPIQLGAHYREAHPDYKPDEGRIKCVVKGCYAKVRAENMAKHMADNHGKAPSKAVVPAKKPAPPPREPWNAKQVVVPVVRELFGEDLPTDSLAEVIDFAEATRRLIERSQQ